MRRMRYCRTSFLLLLLVAAQGFAMGIRKPEPATVTGTIRVVGNEPFTRLVLTTESNQGKEGKGMDYLLVGPLQGELRGKYQGMRVTLVGKECPTQAPEIAGCFEPSRILDR